MQADYRRLFEGMPYTSIVFAPDYTIVDATDEYLAMTMRKRDELVGRNVFVAFPDNPDDPNSNNSSVLKKSIDNAIRTRQTDIMDLLRYDIPKPAEQGGGFDTRYWDVWHVPVMDDKGEVAYIIQRTADATEREMTKKALSDSEDKLNFIAEAMPTMVWNSSPEGNAVYFNHNWVKYTGLPVEKLMTDGWAGLVHPDDISNVRQQWEFANEEKSEFQMDMRLRRHDGEYRWHTARGRARKDGAGNVLMWVGTCTDIHEQKKMVEELLASNEQLSELSDSLENERRTLENLLMEAPAAICILRGPNHKFTFVNPIYQQIFPKRQLVGKDIMDALPEIKGQGDKELLDGVYTTGKTFVGERLPIRLDKYNTGKLIDTHFTFTYQPMYEKGCIIGIMVFAYEVSDMSSPRSDTDNITANDQTNSN